MQGICYTTHKVTRVNEVRLKVKVTRKMVADRAKVSEATVSYVINGSKYVSPEIVKRVRDSITELNYYPDFAARSMVKKTARRLVYILWILPMYISVNLYQALKRLRRNKIILSMFPAVMSI